MGRNVEIKARVRDPEGLRRRAEALADRPAELIVQEDTFFRCGRGRLKLRRLDAGRGELVFYERDDRAGPKESRFVRAPTADPDAMVEALANALGATTVVRKQRTLLRVGQTRVHLDEVEGLGSFLELEVVLQPDQSVADGAAIAHDLMARLGVDEADLVPVAYVDLLQS